MIKVSVAASALILQILSQLGSCQYGAVSLDPKIDSCTRGTNYIYQEYIPLLVVTDLHRVPLRELAQKPLQPENNAMHNMFLACSWKIYNYMTQDGLVRYDNIERALMQAIINQVGTNTGPGNNLSKAEAKNIIEDCKNPSGITPGLKAIQVQNCILERIHRFALI